MATELRAFVRDALARGLPRAQVNAALLAAGWRPEEIASALEAYAEVDFPIPVPRRRPSLSAREAFLYLVLFATLYIAAFDVGVVLFGLIDRALPDATRPRWMEDTATAIRNGTAGLLIAFPVFLIVSRVIARTLAREPEQRSSPVRRWLTYVTLFVAALVLIGDLIVLVGRLLAGELALRFGLKALVVFAIAGAAFSHYLGDLRRDERDGAAPARAGWGARLAVVAIALVALLGLFASGTPGRERRRQIDALRVRDLEAIAEAVAAYRVEYGALPGSLEELTSQPRPYAVPSLQDPETGAPYEYRTLDSLAYELCATFAAPDSLGGRPDGGPGARFWRHEAGRRCFRMRVPTRLRGVLPEPLPR